MRAVEIVFGILKEIRRARTVLSNNEYYSVSGLIELTNNLHRAIELEEGDPGLLLNRIKIELPDCQSFEKLCNTVSEDCCAYTSLYDENDEEYDNACTYDSIYSLVQEKVKQEFSLEINCANEERLRWRMITKLFEDTIEFKDGLWYYNEEKRPEYIRINLEKLYDKVGHPIRLENLYIEYEKAKSTLKEKESILGDFHSKKRNMALALSHSIQKDVIFELNVFAKNLDHVFSLGNKNLREHPQKSKPGRPKNKIRYEKAEIMDLSSCFIDHYHYEKFLSIILEKPGKISGSETRQLFNVLKEKNWLKKEMGSPEDFLKFLLENNSVEVKLIPNSSSSIYNGVDSDGVYNYWSNLIQL